ncbi:GUN4 domain-containing protein [Nostoc sp.]|uniref:GUN4 domain-containing protein n=1 Tax=Nostoc sp. TaxID=1180 RepID=UPI002FFA9307
MTHTASSNEARYRIAKRRIESFSKRFGEPHFYLACHAAFPLALTPDLLYRLWANFQQDVNNNLLNIPWIAVADLLLSNLCNEVGYELYEIDWAIRNELLNQLKNNPCFGQQRILQLSDFLLAYMREQLNSSNPDTRDFAQAQKWTALAYAQPHEAAREIASNLASLNIEDASEWIRLTSLVQTLAEPLAGYEPLLVYVSGMKSFTRGNVTEAKNILSQIMDSKDEIHVAGVKLLIPNIAPIEAKIISQKESTYKLNFRQIAQKKNRLLVGLAGLIFGLAGVQIIYSQITSLNPRYVQLQKLLSDGKWKEADDETAQKMWEVAGRQQERSLREEDFEKFPCEDLRTIDNLWVKYSKEHFGFSVQRHIWESADVNSDFNKFILHVGWAMSADNEKIVFYGLDSLSFDLTVPKGQLPVAVTYDGGNLTTREKYMSRIISCDIGAN